MEMEYSCGAVLYTWRGGKPRYVLVYDSHYGFPKGHIEAGETKEQTALREIREEVGLQVCLDTSFEEELNYIMPNGIAKRSIYFLASYRDQIPIRQEEEVAEIRLAEYEDALQLLTFANMKEALIKAKRYIDEK